jgi:hypothetical protein
MGELAVNTTELTKKADFTKISETAIKNLPVMIESTEKALTAMAAITEINSDEQQEAATLLLSRVKQTYEKVTGLRKEITDPYDEFKKTIMNIENELDVKRGRDNEYNRIKNDIEAYTQRKLDLRKKEEEKLEAQKLIANKLIEFKTAIIKNIEVGPINQLGKADNILSSFFESITLDNYDQMVEALKAKEPSLKQEDYDSWFNVNMDMSGVDQEKIDEVKQQIAKEYDFDTVNRKYVASARKTVAQWLGKLPEQKERLTAIAQAKGEEAKQLQAQLEAKQKIEKELAAKKLEEEKAAAESSIDAEATDAKLEEEFKKQGGEQKLEEVKGQRKFVARLSQENWLKPLATVIYHCAIHKKFPGVYAKDSSGVVKKDAKGREQYITAIDYWLKFFAKNCDASIEGIKLEEDITVQVRK